MPYIFKEKRSHLDLKISELVIEILGVCDPASDTDFAGVLNYCVSEIISQLIIKKTGKLKYWHSALIRGVLADVAQEFYRRAVAPYEDIQINKNGDTHGYAYFDEINNVTK